MLQGTTINCNSCGSRQSAVLQYQDKIQREEVPTPVKSASAEWNDCMHSRKRNECSHLALSRCHKRYVFGREWQASQFPETSAIRTFR